MDILKLLKMVMAKKSSDLHIIAGAPPVIRVHGQLTFTDMDPLEDEDIRKLLEPILNDDLKEKLAKEKELDFSYDFDDNARFRINMYWQRGTLAAAFRLVASEILDLNKLKLPSIVRDMAFKERGLILVTGPTGSGKSTTLAAMIDIINKEQRRHIITLEDPIEYTYTHKKSIISQREIGIDTFSFGTALRECLRQDPDVILIGEMRDLETISIAITAAETGHLVLGTLHTTDAVQTIDRIIDVYPPYQQHQIRTQLALTLQAVISQRLLIQKDGKGRIPAVEIMTVTPAIRNLIREAKTYQIYSNIETGSETGMLTLDQALENLINEDLISVDEAVKASPEPESFKSKLGLEK
ncbi:MAG: type IV pilus twitching motility protein PilT [Candidatus Omnitrophica bacterium]|nr:type IV pilus twitching motility protein PilT [Candidatus Omnitrophota bacterium]